MTIACVLVTHLPVKAELDRDSDLRGKPVLIVTHSSRGPEILDFSPHAEGVSTGMPLQEAMSRCKEACLIEADAAYYHRVFDRIIEALLDTSPFVEKREFGCAFVDMRGTSRLLGGDDRIATVLLDAVPDYGARIGLAKSKFPAYVAAVTSNPGTATRVPEDVTAFLKELPIDLLPLSWENRARFHDFGLHSIGQVASLSVGSLQAQFGTQGKTVWELANGVDRSQLVPSKHQLVVTDALAFPVLATSLFAILPAVELLLGRIFSHPSLRGKHVRAVTIQANIFNRSPWSKKFVFKSPTRRKETAFFALRHALEAADIPGPLEDMRMTVSETAGESGTQSGLFTEVRRQQQLRETIRQLEMRLRARPPVYKVMDVEPWSRIPERRQALVEFAP